MASTHADGAPVTFATLLGAFRRRRGLMLLLFSSTVAGVILAAYLLPEWYETSARILVKVGREAEPPSAIIGLGQQPQATVAVDLRDHINSQVEILRSELLVRRTVAQIGVERILRGASAGAGGLAGPSSGGSAPAGGVQRGLLDRLGLLRQLSPEEEVVRRVQKRLGIVAVPESSVIRVTFRWTEPAFAAEFVNRLVEQYLIHSLDVQRPKGSLAFVSERVGHLQQVMTEAQERLSTYRRTHRSASLADQQRFLLERLMAREAELTDVKADVAGLEAMIRSLDTHLASLAPRVPISRVERSNPLFEALRLREVELEVELKKARVQFPHDSPAVVWLVQQLAMVRERLAQEKPTVTGEVTIGENSTYKALETDRLQKIASLRALGEKRDAVEAAIQLIRGQLETLNRAEAERARLEAESRVATQNYELAGQNLERVRAVEMMDLKKIVSVHPLEPAPVPVRPTRSRLLVLILGLVGSLAVALAGALASERLDRSFRDPLEAERHLHLPTLAIIPEVGERAAGRR